MREIRLANGRGVAIVDDEDYEMVSAYRWNLYARGNQQYAVARVFMPDGTRTSLRMHRLIMPVAALIDHVDGNGLNNTRANLRAADNATNAFNQGPRISKRGRTSRFKGVSFARGARPADRPWHAAIQAFGRRHFLGSFATPEEAAAAYDAAARQYHGEYAWFNFPQRKDVGRAVHAAEAAVAALPLLAG
jgi:hypothetical protein